MNGEAEQNETTLSITSGPAWDTSGSPAFAPLDGDASVDVVVVGAGIAGLMIAAALRDDHRSIAVVEARQVARGVSGSSTAKVTALHGRTYADLAARRGQECARQYAVANQLGVEDFERLIERYDIDCSWARMPSFTYTLDAAMVDEIEHEGLAAATAGLPVTTGTSVDLPYEVAAAVRCEHQGMVDPIRFCTGLASVLERSGARICEHSRVRAIEPDPAGGGFTVHADGGRIRADAVVLATQLPIVDPGLFFARTTPVRSYAMTATLRHPVPQGLYLSIDSPSRSVRPVAAGSSTGVFGGESHRVGEGGDTRRFLRSLEEWVRAEFDVVSVGNRWSAQDYTTPDDVPFIGRMPAAPAGMYVASGFKKWGFSTAAVAGRIIADLIGGRDNPWSTTFDSLRVPHDLRSIGETAQGNAKVAYHFIGDRIRTAHADPISALAPGEGAIVSQHGVKVAAYRDDGGEVHVRSARCTHLGCLVAWNTAERSWDCPCHGSRFDPDGTVVNGPAVRRLDAIVHDGPTPARPNDPSGRKGNEP